MKSSLSRVALILVGGWAGCSDDPKSEPKEDPSSVELNGPCEIGTRIGGFVLDVKADESYSTISGLVADGVIAAAPIKIESEDDECQLVRRLNPFCDPVCGSGFVCGFDGSCRPYPKQIDIGKVTIDGLKETVQLEARAPGNNYFSTGLSHPAIETDDVVTIAVPDSSIGKVDLSGVGSAAVDHDMGLKMEQGSESVLNWTPATGAKRALIAVNVNIDLHGFSPLSLFCRFEDDGEARISAHLIDSLLNSGVSGFPTGSIDRRTVDSQPVEGGCFDFTIESSRILTIDVAGHTPCKKNEDCGLQERCLTSVETCVPE